jgi:uncharacterized protein (TIGR02922 family)
MQNDLTRVTIIYYDNKSCKLLNEVSSFPRTQGGKFVISEEFKKDKSIVAVCLGEVKILDTLVERSFSDSAVV